MGGHNTLVIHNTCEDSLLAAPLILDLVVMAELCERIKVNRICFYSTTFLSIRSNELYQRTQTFPKIKTNEPDQGLVGFRSVLSLLSYFCKAPLVPSGSPVVNSLYRQRTAIENILKACIGLPPNTNMALEQRVSMLYSILCIMRALQINEFLIIFLRNSLKIFTANEAHMKKRTDANHTIPITSIRLITITYSDRHVSLH